jgi:hypothetical protein
MSQDEHYALWTDADGTADNADLPTGQTAEDLSSLYGSEPDIDYDTPAVMPPGEAEALERASWHIKKAAMISSEKSQLAAVYKAEMERLQIRLAHRVRIMNDQIAWHEEPVRSLHLAIQGSNPKRKSIELPYGTSKVTVPKTPTVQIVDQPAVLAWAEANHPELLGHTINVTAVRSVSRIPEGVTTELPGKVFDAGTGEVIPGVESTLAPKKWTPKYDTGDSQ